MAESTSEINSTIEIPSEINSIEESGAEQQPVQPVNNQNANQKKVTWKDSIRNLFSFGRNNESDTRDGPDANSTAGWRQNNSIMISEGINNKKTLANGLMDFAFLTANANQLHNAVVSSESQERTASIVLISISILFQITVGFLLIFGSYIQSKLDSATNSELQGDADQQPNIQAKLFWINLINHATIGLVFLVAVINIFIASFTHS
ncbi:ninjurin-1-like [Daphnia pulicaria]|uniref:ninjurin-1-like n=1 Tax=Daphnia pulicaria TaxID=35523 RepID=UPI001EEA6C31|nr:ninjurin-1-like [Daphnia pulicaria]